MTAICVSLMLATANGATCPPPITEACWSVTSYWVFDENGTAQPWGGQGDSDPSHTANMTYITPADEWEIAAVPFDLVGSTFILSSGVVLNAADTFGHQVYQDGVFWHDHYEMYVIGVDVLTPEPLHYLDCGGRIR